MKKALLEFCWDYVNERSERLKKQSGELQESLGSETESTNAGKVQMIAGIDENGSKFIDIRDNGPGIPPEVMDEIFVPFFTTKSEGTGIGLSLSKRVMQLHGGSIQVRSVPDSETVFRLTFA